MTDIKVRVKDLVEFANLKVIAGKGGLDRVIISEKISRPGLELAGFFDYYDEERCVLIGSKESTYLKKLPEEIMKLRVRYIFTKKPPVIICSSRAIIPEYFKEFANTYDVAFLYSEERTNPLYAKLYSYLKNTLAQRISVHGVLMDIYGMGTLIIGKSGIGKSETALELIKRGHAIISDDRVDMYESEPGLVFGEAPEVLQKVLEIRGIGIVDVVQMFGVGSFRESKKIRLVVELEEWGKDKYYDRLGLDTMHVKYFNTEIVKVVIPVLPGRNVALLVESAAKNEKLKYFGFNAAKEFTEKINKLTKRNMEEAKKDLEIESKNNKNEQQSEDNE